MIIGMSLLLFYKSNNLPTALFNHEKTVNSSKSHILFHESNIL